MKEHSNFTPGPWEVEWADGGRTWVRCAEKRICEIPIRLDTSDIELQANAIIIADASNLYQALLAVRNAVREWKQTGDSQGALEVIEAAIGE